MRKTHMATTEGRGMCVMANPGKEKTQKETPERGKYNHKTGRYTGEKRRSDAKDSCLFFVQKQYVNRDF